MGYSYIDDDPWGWMPFKFNMNNYFDEENYKFRGFIKFFVKENNYIFSVVDEFDFPTLYK